MSIFRFMTRLFVLAALIALVAVLDFRITIGSSTRPSAASDQAAAVIGMTNSLRYEPSRVTIRVGDTIQWNNTSDIPHTVTADASKAKTPDHVRLPAGAAPFDSGTIAPGESWRQTFTAAGHYRYFCIPHESAGMIGDILVNPK